MDYYGLRRNILIDKNMFILEMIPSIFVQYILIFELHKSVDLLEMFGSSSTSCAGESLIWSYSFKINVKLGGQSVHGKIFFLHNFH